MSKSHLIIHTLILVPIFAGCQPGEQVTVSGAVAKPGTYVYQPDRSANSYLEGAGGLTEEALSDSAYLVRGLVDSSGKEIIKSVTISLLEHPEVLPDDVIKVPVRVYDVRLDTVRNGVAGGAMEERTSERVTEISAEVIPDGTIVTREKGGNESSNQPDGYRIVKGVDGSTREIFSDGRILHRSGTGYQVEIFPDGREIESNRFGQKITSWPDGEKEVRMPVAYSYPGPLRTDLAVVNPLPDSVAVGEELTVTGQLHSEVEDISVAAFLAPDGNVTKGNVRRRGRRFQARFRFGEVGHCRVQVQVVLPKARTFTVSHQAVVVGNPEKLEDEVLTIAPYLGDEGAERFLIDEINAARRRIGCQAVLPHPNLMHVARIRLEEMLALGEVSHFSFGGLDVMWHVTTRRLPFFQVSENVANGYFVETMQARWMLSAGHRSNILARHWTHVGVAVAKDRGMVWGVQVFARQ